MNRGPDQIPLNYCGVHGGHFEKSTNMWNLELEDTLTTWESTPGHKSRDRLDPLVHAVGEVLGFTMNTTDKRAGFRGITEIGKPSLGTRH